MAKKFVDKGASLLLICDEMREYPDIELRWHVVGLSFQVQFIKKGVGVNVGVKGINGGIK